MKTKREYLVGLGLAKPGRGKFSNEAKAAIQKAELGGMKFADPNPVQPKTRPESSSTGKLTENQPRRSTGENSPYIFPSDFRFPEGEYRAVQVKDGKKIYHGMRECCNTCMVSLVNHMCDSPTIHNNIAVTIERR